MAACSILVAGYATADGSSSVCAPIAIPGHYGPYNYVTESNKLIIVEQAHFTARVEALLPGGGTGDLGKDLSYTLNASPNHHRALAAITRFGARTRSPQPPGLTYSINCYFDRAVRFSPRDTVVRSLYAVYLAQNGRPRDAIAELDVASSFAADNAVSHYNVGLVYFELAQYDKALHEAHAALRLGDQRQQLAEKLRSVGKWHQPSEAEPPAPATSAPPTAASAPS
jgi:tetratricopeptide (TPR) repeat protein